MYIIIIGIFLILDVIAVGALLYYDIIKLKKNTKNPFVWVKFITTVFLTILNFSYIIHYNLMAIIVAIIARIILIPIDYDIMKLKKNTKNPFVWVKFITTVFLVMLIFSYFIHYNLMAIIVAIIARIILIPIDYAIENKSNSEQIYKKVASIFLIVMVVVFVAIKISSPKIRCKIYKISESYISILPREYMNKGNFIWKIKNMGELKSLLEENNIGSYYEKIINELDIDDTFFKKNYLILTERSGDTVAPKIDYITYDKKNKQIRLIEREGILEGGDLLNVSRFGLYAIKVNKKYDSNDIKWERKAVLIDL